MSDWKYVSLMRHAYDLWLRGPGKQECFRVKSVHKPGQVSSVSTPPLQPWVDSLLPVEEDSNTHMARTYRFWECNTGDCSVKKTYSNDVESIQCHRIPDAHMWGQLLFRKKTQSHQLWGGYTCVFTLKLQDCLDSNSDFVETKELFLHFRSLPFYVNKTFPGASGGGGPCW